MRHHVRPPEPTGVPGLDVPTIRSARRGRAYVGTLQALGIAVIVRRVDPVTSSPHWS